MNQFLQNLKNKLRRFMWGRYGTDELSTVLLCAAFLFLLINSFTKQKILLIPAEALLIWTIFRTYSKNIYKRTQELNTYKGIKNKIFSRIKIYKRMWNDRKTHRYFRCDKCKSYVRVPKGKGQIIITCPKCRNEFTKRT